MAGHHPDDEERHSKWLESITIVMFVLSWVFIALRTWTRAHIKPNFGWDDFTMILAGMVFTSYCGCIFYIVLRGGGTHIESIPQMNTLITAVIASEASYLMTMMVLKTSVAIFFARIVIKRWMLIVIYTTVAISCVSSLASFFYCILRCGPDLSQYLMRQLEFTCTPRTLDRFFAYQHAAVAFSTDCVFVLLPIPLLWNANMSRRSKISIGLILSLAALGCVCSAIRFQYVDSLTQINDFFWNATNISAWSTVEAGAGIMAGCMATLRPLAKAFFGISQTLRSSMLGKTVASQSTGPRSNSSNTKGNGNKQADTTLPQNPAAAPVIQLDRILTRTSHSTSVRSEDGFLSQVKELHSLELGRTSTWGSGGCSAGVPVHHIIPMPYDATDDVYDKI